MAEISTLVAHPEVLKQDGSELDQPKGRLAPGDDGVHAGTVAVVGADTAVAVTVEGRSVTACSAVAFAGDEIDEGRFFGLLQHAPLFVQGGFRAGDRDGGRGILTDPRLEISASIRVEIPSAKRLFCPELTEAAGKRQVGGRVVEWSSGGAQRKPTGSLRSPAARPVTK